jgi:hypothetical protein
MSLFHGVHEVRLFRPSRPILPKPHESVRYLPCQCIKLTFRRKPHDSAETTTSVVSEEV